MTPRQREKLQAAAKFVGKERSDGVDAEAIILGLIAMHGANRSVRSGAFTLRCAGVVGSCTWSRDAGLLKSWNGNATVRLAMAAMA